MLARTLKRSDARKSTETAVWRICLFCMSFTSSQVHPSQVPYTGVCQCQTS